MVAYASAKLAWREAREAVCRLLWPWHVSSGGVSAGPCIGVDEEGFRAYVQRLCRQVGAGVSCPAFGRQAAHFGPTDVAKICRLPKERVVSEEERLSLREREREGERRHGYSARGR